jgi:hypothetical protein
MFCSLLLEFCFYANLKINSDAIFLFYAILIKFTAVTLLNCDVFKRC